MSAYREALLAGCRALDCPVTGQQCEQLLAYHALLVKWNRAYNLTAVRDAGAMIQRHLLDSLSIVPAVADALPASDAPRLLDVGSGAGLPGIPLQLMLPALRVTLLDSNGKKTRFLQQAKADLALDHLTVVQQRVDAYRPPAPFELIVSRAFASLADMLQSSEHLLAPAGRWLAMKGRYPAEELSQVPKRFIVLATERLRIPGSGAERHLVLIGREPSHPPGNHRD